MLINLTNHPSEKWDEIQRKTAEDTFGEVIDVPFPQINPEAEIEDIRETVDEYSGKIKEMRGEDGNITVHIMGEMTFTYEMVKRLKEAGIGCVASTTARETVELATGEKVSKFRFVRFREY